MRLSLNPSLTKRSKTYKTSKKLKNPKKPQLKSKSTPPLKTSNIHKIKCIKSRCKSSNNKINN